VALRMGRRRTERAGVDVADEALTIVAKVAILIAVVLIAGSTVAYAYERASAEQFYPSTRIGGVLIGSRTTAEAEELLKTRFVLPLHNPMKITAADFETKASPWEMGMRVDVHDIVRDALVEQHNASFPVRMWHRAFGEERAVKLKPLVDEKIFADFLNNTFERVDQDPVDARLEIVEGEVKLRVIPHQLGREVDAGAAEQRVFDAMMAGASSVDLPVNVKQPTLRTESFDTAIIISTSANILKLYGKGELRKKYGVATGTGGYPTPRGQFRITAKRMNPTWYNPNAQWSADMPAFIPPGPNNPLGTRALNLNASGIRIHGTPDDASIGTNASHGCIRMHMKEVEELFGKVNVGTPVLIVS
jgi:lipoprotein-anchoring transpeptidase ErfK/SrfK